MKTINIVLLSFALFTTSLFSQTNSPQGIDKEPVPQGQLTPPVAPVPPQAVTPSPATNQPAQLTPPLRPQPVFVAPVVREKTEEELRDIETKTIAFQTTRASEGSPSAQYDLGIRFLNGDGVEQSDAEARRWLEASALRGNTLAISKLAEMNQQ